MEIDVTRSIFEIQGLSFRFVLIFMSFKIMFSNIGSPAKFSMTSFLPPPTPPPGNMVRKIGLKFCPKFLFLIFRKSEEDSFHSVYPFEITRRLQVEQVEHVCLDSFRFFACRQSSWIAPTIPWSRASSKPKYQSMYYNTWEQYLPLTGWHANPVF